MTRFKDEYLPDCVNSYNATSSPEFSTDIVAVDSGAEAASQRWAQALNRYNIPQAVRDMVTFQAVRDHWLVMRGPFHSFPFRDPLDFASVDLAAVGVAPTVSATDQVIGTGNGTTTNFQLTKTYSRGAEDYVRNIYKPVTSSVLVSLNGTPQGSGWTVSRTTGVITFDVAPGNGVIVRAGYLYDVEVRFESDQSFDAIARAYQAAGYSDIQLAELRPC